jgi:hypothetical protein
MQYYRQRNDELQAKMRQQWLDGTIRTAPMATQTVIQIFWANDGNYSEENSTDARIGHEEWKDIAVTLPTTAPISRLRVDFFSALTTIEIAALSVETKSGRVLFRAATPADFASIALLGNCVQVASDPVTLKVTGVDPQLHLPPFSPTDEGDGVAVQMRLKVTPTLA